MLAGGVSSVLVCGFWCGFVWIVGLVLWFFDMRLAWIWLVL